MSHVWICINCAFCCHSQLLLQTQVWPICGDGLDLEIRHTVAGEGFLHLQEGGWCKACTAMLLCIIMYKNAQPGLRPGAGTGASTQLHWQAVNPDAAHDRPQRQKVEFRVALHTGDTIDFMVHPRGSMDCDGVYIVDMQIWRNEGGLRTHETRRLRRTS